MDNPMFNMGLSLIWGSLLNIVETLCLLLYSTLPKLAPFLLLWGLYVASSLPNSILTFTQLTVSFKRMIDPDHYLLPARQYHRRWLPLGSASWGWKQCVLEVEEG